MGISLIDLSRQYSQIKNEVEKNVLNVMRSSNYVMGTQVHELEDNMKNYFNMKYAISVASGTDALILALCALGIGEGDEVITTTFTFFATAESIVRVGATPVFVDVDEETLNIDVTKIERAITKKTKAILPVHIFGNPCDMDEINRIAKENDLYVIEDACQAIGAKYKGKKIGSISDVACFSFFPTKNLGGMGDGGLIVTNDEKLNTIITAFRNHGAGIPGRKALEYLNDGFKDSFEIKEGFEKYYNYLIGYNSRLDEMQAAILNVKLKYIDEWNENRRILAKRYETELGQIYNSQKTQSESESVYHMYTLLDEKRDELVAKLNEYEIATGIYYPVPMHLQKAFADLGYKQGDFPVVEKVCNEAFSIPVFPELFDEEQNQIIKILKDR